MLFVEQNLSSALEVFILTTLGAIFRLAPRIPALQICHIRRLVTEEGVRDFMQIAR